MENSATLLPPRMSGAATSASEPGNSVTPEDSFGFQNETVMTEGSHRPLRAVIVEDEAIIAMELEMLLEGLGIEVIGMAMSAAEAEALAAAERPDFLTMDINIKGSRDGVEAACAIFEKLGISSIFVSAFSDAATKARAASARPLGWVRKPVDPYDLADAVARVPRSKT